MITAGLRQPEQIYNSANQYIHSSDYKIKRGEEEKERKKTTDVYGGSKLLDPYARLAAPLLNLNLFSFNDMLSVSKKI
jgi:hypothetical protein